MARTRWAASSTSSPRRATGPAQFNVRTEGGSYGTAVTNGSVTGSSGPWSYAVTGGGQHSNGFSRYGYRIPPLEARFGPLERDGFDRVGGSARFGYDAGEGVRLETGMLSSFTRSAYDQSTGTFPDTPSSATRLLQQVWGRASVDTFGGILTHSLNVFDTHIDRSFNDVTYRINKLPQNTTSIISDFIGNSTGAEYQGNLKLGALGSLIAGTRTQHETANTYSTNLLPNPGPRIALLGKAQDTNSVFALWQLPIGERLNITLGGRVDDVVDVARFETWRATAAYTIAETGTKFHTSAGTGAKAPTLFQLYDPANGNAGPQTRAKLRLRRGHRSIPVQWPRDRLGHRLLERLQQSDQFCVVDADGQSVPRHPDGLLCQRRPRRDQRPGGGHDD